MSVFPSPAPAAPTVAIAAASLHAPRTRSAASSSISAANSDELTDTELESVVGGLARSYMMPIAPVSRRPL